MNDPALRKTARTGWWLLALALPLGLTLEALHAFRVPVYLGSELRRELWTLAHAHGAMLGLVCLLHSLWAERFLEGTVRARAARSLRWAAALMPSGFFLGGVLNSEGDPSLGILLVPLGAVLLLHGLAITARHRAH